MPSIVGPARFQRPRKLKTNAATPINQAVAEWHERQREGNRAKPEREAVPPPAFGRAADPRALPDAMRANREAVFAVAWAGVVERHFRNFLSLKRCPLDDWIVFIELTRAWAEWLYVTAAANPAARRTPCLPGCRGLDDNGKPCQNLRCWGAAFCPDHQEDEDRRAGWAPRTEAEARAAGLSIERR